MSRSCTRTLLVLSAFSALFIGITVSSYRQKSATVDEPVTVSAGYLPLKLADYRLDPQHPPLLRMWAALPLLLMRDVELDTNSASWAAVRQWDFSHEFLYRQNDADRLLYRARFMIVILGVVLGTLVFSWARELFGFWPAVITLALYTLEPNILAHASLATTDLGVTCFIFGTMYFLWRTSRRLSAANLIGLVVFFALAQVSKFSALLLGPLVVVILLIQVYRPDAWAPWTRQRRLVAAAAAVVALAVASYLTLWAAYGFRYLPAATESWTFRWEDGEIATNVPRLARMMAWIDEHRLLPNAYAQGFLFMMGGTQERAAFLAGAYSSGGWWYYFPVAFLIKTPISLIVLLAAGLGLCGTRRKGFLQTDVFIVLPLIVYFGAGIATKADIGLRYVLPIYPFVILLAGKAVAKVMETQRSVLRFAFVGLCALLLAEAYLIYPHHLAFFNLLVGGARNGHHYLVDSNLDWGQDLKLLKWWMETNGVQHVNLSYFGSADPEYYGISCTHLPGAPFFVRDRVIRPQLPGYLAISATNLREVYAEDPARDFYAQFREQTPVAVLGYSVFVYWVERPWW